LERASAAAGVTPVIGIGGIASGDVEAVIASGAWGVAAVRGIWSAPDPGAAVKQYLEVLGE
jgi:thiamine monophosphate synthase